MWWVLVAAIVLAFALGIVPQVVANRVVKRHPTGVVWTIQVSLAGIIVVGGGIAVGLAAVGAVVEGLIAHKNDGVSKAVAKTIGGAVGVVGSIMVLDDLQSGTGAFWPSSRIRKLFQSAFYIDFPN